MRFLNCARSEESVLSEISCSQMTSIVMKKCDTLYLQLCDAEVSCHTMEGCQLLWMTSVEPLSVC